MRILLVTEGASDEPVAEHLVRRVFRQAEIERKRLSVRGFEVVARQLEIWLRAAHFGHYDLLIVHFDLDDSIPGDFQSVTESGRWRDISTSAEQILSTLPDIGRDTGLRLALMTPCQSTEAWLAWGVENEDGAQWEKANRHDLKRKLFGNPPRGLVRKAEILADQLVDQMDSSQAWPRSLRDFYAHLDDKG